MNEVWKSRLAGGAAGLANGLFGGGGGMVFIPLMSHSPALKGQRLFATCVAVIFPVCAVSSAVYFLNGNLSLSAAFPYLLGGLAGGFLGGRLYGRISTVWLRRLFALFLFYAGVKYLL